MVESERMVGAVFGLEDLASTYILCPSNLSVPNFKLERLEVLEYIRMSEKKILDKSEGSEDWKCSRGRS